jgi:hypothetical protein
MRRPGEGTRVDASAEIAEVGVPEGPLKGARGLPVMILESKPRSWCSWREAPQREVGGMFWFRRKKLSGS